LREVLTSLVAEAGPLPNSGRLGEATLPAGGTFIRNLG
jgi:hypothetical protein